MTYQCLKRVRTVRDQVVVKLHDARLEQEKQSRASKLEVPQLLRSLDLLSLLASDDRRTDHHGTDANDHHSTVAHRVDWHANPNVLAIDVQGASDGHRIDRVVLTIEQLGLAHCAIHRDVEAVVVLGRESEDTESTIPVPLRILGIRITK